MNHNPRASYRVVVHCMTFWNCLQIYTCLGCCITSTQGIRCVTSTLPDTSVFVEFEKFQP